MGDVNDKWRELADVRSRTRDLGRRVATTQKVSRSESDNEMHLSENYADGSRAIRFDSLGHGFVYYPSGAIAVVVTKVNDYAKNFFFYADGHEGGHLVAFVSNLAEGFALRANRDTKEQERLIWNSRSGVLLKIRGSNTLLTKKWRWSESSEIPPVPIEVQMNDALKMKFSSQDKIIVEFELQSVLKSFDCGLKVKRTDTYLDKKNSRKDITGKFVLRPEKLRSMREKRESAKAQSVKLDSNRWRTTVENKEIRDMMSSVESFFEPLDRRISTQTFSVSVAPHKSWKKDALDTTFREVPTITPTGQEIAGSLGTLSLVSNSSKPGKRWVRSDGKIMNNLEIHNELLKQNPNLRRPEVLVAASGRYSREAKVKGPDANFKKLRLVTSATFDKTVNEEAAPDQLVVVACLRKDDLACRKAEQLLEKVNGLLSIKHAKEGVSPHLLTKFEMSESNFLKRRYNIQTLPMYLMFYNRALVYGGTLGGSPIRIPYRNKRPPLLLVERNATDQMKLEKILRKIKFEWDLASNIRGAQHHSSVRRASGGHCIVLISTDTLTDKEAQSNVALFRKGSQGKNMDVRNQSLTVVVLKSGTVRFSKRPIFDERGKRVQRSKSVSDSRRGTTRDSACACLKTRIVDGASNDVLRGAHFAVQKPLSAATIEALVALWKRKALSLDDSKSKLHHVGLSVKAMMRKMRDARQDGREGKTFDLPFGTSLSGEGTVVCNTKIS